jgi:OOP family OmpA-OmpF porin
LDIKFDFDVVVPQRGSDIDMTELADFMKQYPATQVTIEGHTDDRGAADYNLFLSQQRADYVKRALVSRGIVLERILVKGLGETQPVADNATRDGRGKNRRVVATITVGQ